jgi:putative thioredoxin
MFSVDVNEQNFMQVVIEGSKKTPVVIDFWAPWCEPCKTLKPILEKLAEEYQGKFILAKINSDENQKISAQFAVRGIPAVKAVVDSKVVNEFSGALPESEVREFLNGLIPSPADELHSQAQQAHLQDDTEQAVKLLDQALAIEPTHEKSLITKAGILAAGDQLETAIALLNQLSPASQIDPSVVALKSQITIKQQSRDAPAESELVERIKQNPADLEARMHLANQLVAQQQFEAAVEQLFEIIRQDRTYQDEYARKTLVTLFELLGAQDPRVREYRRQLSRLLN